MKSAASKTPGPVEQPGDAVTEEPAADEHPETPGEQTLTFAAIRDDTPPPATLHAMSPEPSDPGHQPRLSEVPGAGSDVSADTASEADDEADDEAPSLGFAPAQPQDEAVEEAETAEAATTVQPIDQHDPDTTAEPADQPVDGGSARLTETSNAARTEGDFWTRSNVSSRGDFWSKGDLGVGGDAGKVGGATEEEAPRSDFWSKDFWSKGDLGYGDGTGEIDGATEEEATKDEAAEEGADETSPEPMQGGEKWWEDEPRDDLTGEPADDLPDDLPDGLTGEPATGLPDDVTDEPSDGLPDDSTDESAEDGPAGLADEVTDEPAGHGRVRQAPMPEPVSAALTQALEQLRGAVKDLHFGLDIPGAEEARTAQAAVLAQLADYVIPRIHTSTAPALIVVAGSTGAGKSTLVNTLAAQRVSATGVRRPTTGTPVLACHPDDREWFESGGLLSELRRLDKPEEGSGTDSLVLAPTERLPPGVALLDTPDIDSVVEEHNEIAHRMLDAADLWVFVTTASRYADAPSWGLLRLAKERGARLVIVLSRVPPKSRDVIVKHFGRMLAEYGLGEVERFVVNETAVENGRLPDREVTDLRMWLADLSVDDERRSAAVKATLNGVLNSFRSRMPALARHLETQVALRADLRSDVDAAFMGALAEIDEATQNGSLLRGEVLARWQNFAGSGELIRTLQLRRARKGQQQSGPERVRALKSALGSALDSLITAAAQRASEEVVARWRQRAGAGDRLAAIPGLGTPSDEVVRRTARTIISWQDYVTELIRTEGVTKRAVAKLVSFDLESLAVIFTVGLLGYGTAEVSGTGALPQRLLRGLMGAESLRAISAKARSDLRARIALIFDDETLRYVDALDGAGIPDEAAATRLYQATYNLEVAR